MKQLNNKPMSNQEPPLSQSLEQLANKLRNFPLTSYCRNTSKFINYKSGHNAAKITMTSPNHFTFNLLSPAELSSSILRDDLVKLGVDFTFQHHNPYTLETLTDTILKLLFKDCPPPLHKSPNCNSFTFTVDGSFFTMKVICEQDVAYLEVETTSEGDTTRRTCESLKRLLLVEFQDNLPVVENLGHRLFIFYNGRC